jgi:hypothetical protein
MSTPHPHPLLADILSSRPARALRLAASWGTLLACVLIEWHRRPTCKTCGAKPDRAMLRGDGCVLCQGRRR